MHAGLMNYMYIAYIFLLISDKKIFLLLNLIKDFDFKANKIHEND